MAPVQDIFQYNGYSFDLSQLPSGSSDEITLYIVLGVLAVWYTTWSWIFWKNRRDDFLQRRLPIAVQVTSIVIVAVTVVFGLETDISNFVTRDPRLCYVTIILDFVLTNMLLSTFSVRAAHILFTYALNQIRVGNLQFTKSSSRFESFLLRVSVRFVFSFFLLLVRTRQRFWIVISFLFGTDGNEAVLPVESTIDNRANSSYVGRSSTISRRQSVAPNVADNVHTAAKVDLVVESRRKSIIASRTLEPDIASNVPAILVEPAAIPVIQIEEERSRPAQIDDQEASQRVCSIIFTASKHRCANLQAALDTANRNQNGGNEAAPKMENNDQANVKQSIDFDMDIVNKLGTVKDQDIITMFVLQTILGILAAVISMYSYTPYLLTGDLLPSSSPLPFSCNKGALLPSHIMGITIMLPILPFMWLIRKMPDPQLMRRELIFSTIPFVAGITTFLIDFHSQRIVTFKQGPFVWMMIMGFLMHFSSVIVPLYWCWQRSMERNQMKFRVHMMLLQRRKSSTHSAQPKSNSVDSEVHTATSPGLTRQGTIKHDRARFEAILQNPITYFQFKKIVADAMCIENCLFHEAYLKYRALAALDERGRRTTVLGARITHPTAQDRAIVVCDRAKKHAEYIYDSFLKSDAKYELNIKSSTLATIRKDINEGATYPAMFDTVYEEVLKLMCTESQLVTNLPCRRQ